MISIVKPPNIMALFHFNDTLADETGAAILTSLKTNTSYASGKFSKGLTMLGDGTTGWEMSNINFGTGDFTIDFWFYGTATPTKYAKFFESTLYNVAGGIMAEVTPNTTTTHVRQCGSDYSSHQLSFSYSLNTWTHFAIVKKAGVITVYQNGVSVGSFTATNNLTATTMKIGASADTANNVSAPGVMDELRISNIARWTANFTPPTSPYVYPSITITPGGVIPKKHALRRRMAISNAPFTFEYTGNYTDSRDANGIGTVEFTSSGTLIVLSGKVRVSAYILGAGGGAAVYRYNDWTSYASTGGSGGNQTVEVELAPGTYEIIIGVGGSGKQDHSYNYNNGKAGDGGNTIAFGYTSTGGTGGNYHGNLPPGTGGTPNGKAGTSTTSLSYVGTLAGGSPNGGSVAYGVAQSGGNGLIRLTFS